MRRKIIDSCDFVLPGIYFQQALGHLAHKKLICLVCQWVKLRCILGYPTKFRVKTTSWPLFGRHVATHRLFTKSTKIWMFSNITNPNDNSLPVFSCLGGETYLPSFRQNHHRPRLWAARLSGVKCHMMCFCLTDLRYEAVDWQKKLGTPNF